MPVTGTSACRAAAFLDERQILAALDHPNIARIMDGGGNIYLAD